MPITLGDIVNALSDLGGEAHYRAIAEHIVAHATPPFPADPAASVRARLQENCSDYRAYLGKADIFSSAEGSGIWRLRAHTAPATDAGLEAREGGQILRQHLVRERDAKLVQAFKQGLDRPCCEACGLDFAEVYGDLGVGYIEAHHRVALADDAAPATTRLADLAALCANCHRIIHRNYPISVEELAARLQSGWGSDVAAVQHQRRSWRDAVRAAIGRIVARQCTTRFTRQALIAQELDHIVADVAAIGATPEQSLSRVLQELRDNGLIAFDGARGEYRLVTGD